MCQALRRRVRFIESCSNASTSRVVCDVPCTPPTRCAMHSRRAKCARHFADAFASSSHAAMHRHRKCATSEMCQALQRGDTMCHALKGTAEMCQALRRASTRTARVHLHEDRESGSHPRNSWPTRCASVRDVPCTQRARTSSLATRHFERSSTVVARSLT